VRSALALVARGQTPLGIVYRTDTRISDAVVELAEFPLASHPQIRYQGALIDPENDEASSVLTFLTGEHGQAAFASFGFLPPLDAVQ
jgi:molybdate transport system substrate-binding protein